MLLLSVVLFITIAQAQRLPTEPIKKPSFVKQHAPLLVACAVLPSVAYLGVRYKTNVTPAMVSTTFFCGAIKLHREYNDNSWMLAVAAGIGSGLIQTFVVKQRYQ